MKFHKNIKLLNKGYMILNKIAYLKIIIIPLAIHTLQPFKICKKNQKISEWKEIFQQNKKKNMNKRASNSVANMII